jgi:hypothetical protein
VGRAGIGMKKGTPSLLHLLGSLYAPLYAAPALLALPT